MAAPDWAPTPDQVAAGLYAYTRGERGSDGALSIAAEDIAEQGRFTETTRPTIDAVKGLIEQACGSVIAAFGGRAPCTEHLRSSAATAAIYKAQQLVCASYFPESTRGENNAFDALQKLYDDVIGPTARTVVEHCPLNPDDPADDGGALAPAGRGRNPCFPVMGFATRW